MNQKFDFKSEKVNPENYQLNPETLDSYLSKNLAIIFDKNDIEVKTEKELGNYLVQLKRGIDDAGMVEIGHYGGLRMYIETLKLKDYDNRISLEQSVFIQGKSSEKYSFNGGMMANTPDIAVHYPQRALLKIPLLVESVHENINNLQKNLGDLKKFMVEDFKGESELVTVKKAIEKLKDEIENTMEKKEKTIDIDFKMKEGQSIEIHAKGNTIRH